MHHRTSSIAVAGASSHALTTGDRSTAGQVPRASTPPGPTFARARELLGRFIDGSNQCVGGIRRTRSSCVPVAVHDRQSTRLSHLRCVLARHPRSRERYIQHEGLTTLARTSRSREPVKCLPVSVDWLRWLIARVQAHQPLPHRDDASAEAAPSLSQHWQSDYVILLWLSVAVLVPFQLASFGCDIVPLLLKQCQSRYLGHAGRPRDAAAVLIARSLSRYLELISAHHQSIAG